MQQPMTSPRDTVKDAPPAATPVAPESSARMRTGNTDPGLGPASTNPSPPPVEAEDPLATLDGPLPGYKVTAAQSDGLDAAAFHAAARNPPRSGYDTFDEKPSIIGPQITPTPPPAAMAPEPTPAPRIHRPGDTTQDSERKKRSKTTALALIGGIVLLGVIAFVIKSASCASDTQPSPSATTTTSAAPTETTPPTATTSATPIPTETIAPTTTTTATVTPTATASTGPKPTASAKPTATTPPSATTAPTPSTSASIDPLTHLLGSH